MFSYTKATYEYAKLRKNFGRQPLFQMASQLLDSINPSEEDQKDYVLRNPVDRGVQATQPLSVNEVCTPSTIMCDQGMNHTEGGWPRDIHITNEDHVLRHRRRVMHDESYCESISKLAPTMSHYINQNNAIEMYETYYSDYKPLEPVETSSIRIVNIFRDARKRPISSIKFTNESNPKLAVAYCYKTCMPNLELNVTNSCYLWDIHEQTKPIHEILPESPCWQLACSPISPELIIGGLENGTVHIFDIRQGQKAVSSSSVYNSHRESITALRFIQSRTHSDFFTGSSDGQCLWWDLRDLSKPLDQLSMSIKIPSTDQPSPSNAQGVSYLEFDYGLPTKFLCGTESGLVINVNRMGKTYSEKLTSYWNAHNGPVQTVQRSPCTMRMFITCGDYTVRIWSEEVHSQPIILSKPYKSLVAEACWAPLRYSCYMSICTDGIFYFWDLLRKYKEPIKTLNLSKYPLTKMTPQQNGQSVAVGDSQGSLYLLQLSENLTIPGPHDKNLMQQLYERERKREHILDNRVKEIRLKAKAEEEKALKEVPAPEMTEEELDQTTEEEYFRVVQEELNNMDMYPDIPEPDI